MGQRPPGPKTLAMVGRWYGDVKVLGVGPVMIYRTQSHRGVWAQCKCGVGWLADGPRLRYGDIKRCNECRAKIFREWRHMNSIKLPSGKTITQIADATGLKANTVYRRWRRGWPERDLARKIHTTTHIGSSKDIRPARNPWPKGRARRERIQRESMSGGKKATSRSW